MLRIFTKITNLLLIATFGIVLLALCLPTKGVKTANNLEAYARRYLTSHNILNPEERIAAYYDSSFLMNSKEALILTNKRIIHHYDQKSASINLDDVTELYYVSKKHNQKTIVVRDKNDEILCLALYHDQELFIDLLNSALKNKFNL